MIIGYLDKWETYKAQMPQLEEIAEIVRTCREKPAGRYETDWGFYMIQEGETSAIEDKVFECHRNYIDVQCVAEGGEYMEWADIRALAPDTEYSGEKDVQFLKGQGCVCKVDAGMFYAVYPEDGHKPGCHIETPLAYRKVVAKVRVSN